MHYYYSLKTDGLDFRFDSNMTTFFPNQMEAVVHVHIVDDSIEEESEMFPVIMYTDAANVIFGDNIATVTLNDDDG